jgi:hypothetical protein
VLNLKAANKLGLTFSPLLLRTDEVIESALPESLLATQIDFRCSAAVGGIADMRRLNRSRAFPT